MKKRVGITTDIERRRKELEDEYAKIYDLRVIKENLTKRQAQDMENDYRENKEYMASAGGKDVSGNSWSVYTFETAF